MLLEDKKKSFIALGHFLKQFTEVPFVQNPSVLGDKEIFEQFSEAINSAINYNKWFTLDQLILSLNSWSQALTADKLDKWTSNYSFEKEPLKEVGLILAGNIPLVGFHDFLSVLISGNKVLIKMSSNDNILLPILAKYLISIEPRFKNRINFVDDNLENFDAVIATGSNNTARYFDYYFSKVPNIIRKNRNSVAVLKGTETKEELINLGKDIFTYFGLGCRNVSKLYVPVNYNFDDFFQAMYHYKDIIDYEKYSNNYDYNKAVFLMSDYKILDNGFLTIKEDTSYSSPISSVFYEYYDNLDTLQNKLDNDREKIQCIVSDGSMPNSVYFGKTQFPNLDDYADGVDTLEFLLNL